MFRSKQILSFVFGALSVVLLSVLMSCTSPEPPEVLSIEPSFGPRETLITVQGMNFDDLIAINFNNGIPADFNPSFGTGEALLFRVPNSAEIGEHLISIETEHGATTMPFRVTFQEPTISSFGPKSANVGDHVVINGENFFEPVEVLFFDSISANILYLDQDSLVVEVPENVQKGRLRVKANGGTASTAEVFFTTKDILVNDFDGNGVRAETSKWLFYGNIDQVMTDPIQNTNPDGVDGNYLKISGKDPGSIWVGGTESHSNDISEFISFGITSDINNTFLEMDVNSDGADFTHLIIVLAERDGSPKGLVFHSIDLRI